MSFRITGTSPFNPSIAIEKSNVRPSIENLENCPEKEPCSTCGRVDPCSECLISNNPLANSNTLTDNICKEILQLPSNPSKTPSNPRKLSSSTHYTHPDNLRNLASKQKSLSRSNHSSPSPNHCSPVHCSPTHHSPIPSYSAQSVLPQSGPLEATCRTKRGRRTRLPARFRDNEPDPSVRLNPKGEYCFR